MGATLPLRFPRSPERCRSTAERACRVQHREPLTGRISIPILAPAELPRKARARSFDTFDGRQGGISPPYTLQAVAYNNTFPVNEGRRLQVFYNSKGSFLAKIYAYNNISWVTSSTATRIPAARSASIVSALNIVASYNIPQTTAAMDCGGYALYAYYVTDASNRHPHRYFAL